MLLQRLKSFECNYQSNIFLREWHHSLAHTLSHFVIFLVNPLPSWVSVVLFEWPLSIKSSRANSERFIKRKGYRRLEWVPLAKCFTDMYCTQGKTFWRNAPRMGMINKTYCYLVKKWRPLDFVFFKSVRFYFFWVK